MLKIVSQDRAPRPGGDDRAERRAVLDEPPLLPVEPDEVRDVVDVRMRAGGDRRGADRGQRRERRERARGRCRRWRGTRAAGASSALDRALEDRRRQAVDHDQDELFWDISPWRGCAARRSAGRAAPAQAVGVGRARAIASRVAEPRDEGERGDDQSARATRTATPRRVPPPRSARRRSAPRTSAPRSPPIPPAAASRPVADEQADADSGRDGEHGGESGDRRRCDPRGAARRSRSRLRVPRPVATPIQYQVPIRGASLARR